ncbi:MAG: response regulator transcription factor [Treponema sp.]|nr:response regulator transcription factor [Treponema sp.]
MDEDDTKSANTGLRILLADDQILFAESLKTFLNNYAEDMNIVGIARNGKEALDMSMELKPDIILMDIRMPIMDGVEAVQAIKPKFPDIKIVMLSTYDEDTFVHSALHAGASGYLLKDISPTEFIAAIRALSSGLMQISPEIVRRLIEARYAPSPEHKKTEDAKAVLPPENGAETFEWLKELTERERKIFTLIARGYDNDQISTELNLALQTVRNQVSAIYSKLEVKNRFEIIRLANQRPRKPGGGT